MKVLPERKIERDELNLRLGIKSSLPKIQEFSDDVKKNFSKNIIFSHCRVQNEWFRL